MKGRNDEIMKAKRVDLLITILVLGSLWGFSEVVVGGVIGTAGVPCRAGILTGLGMAIMGIAISTFRRPLILVGVALVAILCKQLVVPIIHASVLCEANSCLAVTLQGFALVGVVSLAGRKLDRGYLAKIASGASAALLAAVAFYFIGMQVAPCRYLLSFNRPGGFMAFLAAEGLVWATFSAVLFPLGYLAGARLRDAVPVLGTRKSLHYYTTSAALVVCCWVASALAIAFGL